MYSISLLPYEYKIIQQKARKKNISLLIATGVMGVLFVAYMILSIYASGKIAELNGIKAEKTAIEAQIDNIGDIKVIYDEVNKSIGDIMTAAGTNPDWNRFIVDIGNTVPDSIVLKSINLSYQGNSGECTIHGVGLNHLSVSAWLKNLEDVPGIGEINCKFSSRHDTVDDSVEFELSFPILKGSGYKISLEVIVHE